MGNRTPELFDVGTMEMMYEMMFIDNEIQFVAIQD